MKILPQEMEEALGTLNAYHRTQFENIYANEQGRKRPKRSTAFSLTRALHGLSMNEVERLAPGEHEWSERIAEAVGRPPRPGHLFVPIEQRDLNVAIGSAGGYTVQTDVGPGGLFVGFLNAALGQILGWLTRVPMEGNASIPAASGNVTSGWLATESTSLTESQFAFTVAAATPKSVGAYTEASRSFMKSTTAFAQQYILRLLAQAVASEVYAKIISGSGASGQPTGLLNTAGIGSVSGTGLAYAGILDAAKLIEDSSAIVNPATVGFVIAPDAARLLRIREKAVGSGTIMTGSDLAGYPAVVTKATPDASLVVGDWSQCALLEWGILEVGTDPYGVNSALFSKGLVGLRAIWTADVVCLQPKSFVKITSIT